ncbi:MAG: hypothetical protein GXP21_06450 [Gammaproteobacteria bacterium]|nr:hypothetical protein [Gammaproteobacteria bacterium]
MDKSTVYELVKSAIGFDYFKVGTSGIDRAVNLRRTKTDNASTEEYIAYLRKSGGNELALLIEEIVVPETWFFRDRTPFDYLAQYVTGEWLDNRGERRLNILSFPCSTGEEPYSIAMVLKQIGVPKDLINIDAFDISGRCVETARRGIYRENSFRGDEDSRCQRFFDRQGSLYYLDDEVREMVNFRQGNILETSTLLARHKYDIIFCRNLLIYLETDTQLQVCQSLVDSIVPGGVFFVGHAEVNSVQRLSQLESVKHKGAFVFIKAEKKSARLAKPEKNSVNAVRNRPNQNDAAIVNRFLIQAEQLIDASDFIAARYLCQSAVEMAPLNSRGFYLLATIARKKEDWLTAKTLYQKVLYLDSEHMAALEQLMECAKQLDDEGLLTLTTQRIERLRSRMAS